MLDTVITLKAVPKEVGAEVPDAKLLQAGTPETPAPSESVARFKIRLLSPTPHGQCRLRLWDASGRAPLVIDEKGNVGGTAKDWDFSASLDATIGLERPAAQLNSSTLTWSVRFYSRDPAGAGDDPAVGSYKLLLQVIENEAPVPGASFSYSGPLDDYEEVTGRFHFSVVDPPAGLTGRPSQPARP